ncbi:basic proline-rich protein-like [Phacochoerus africanus]|uniref:basic proline-rich protein-like n=1 Tax=Phacochoerus africanus TaxID=41426 RepID=UPI001FDA3651|nr:basic proline-rich protein-like [Phacochoerus africanus]
MITYTKLSISTSPKKLKVLLSRGAASYPVTSTISLSPCRLLRSHLPSSSTKLLCELRPLLLQTLSRTTLLHPTPPGRPHPTQLPPAARLPPQGPARPQASTSDPLSELPGGYPQPRRQRRPPPPRLTPLPAARARVLPPRPLPLGTPGPLLLTRSSQNGGRSFLLGNLRPPPPGPSLRPPPAPPPLSCQGCSAGQPAPARSRGRPALPPPLPALKAPSKPPPGLS